ncbi:MAG: hypothetical protein U0800_00060 [Isosphaeraceae bacterium]
MYRRNTPGQTLGFRLVNAATGASLTGASVTAYRSIDGGAQAPADGAIAEKGNGQYVFSPSANDLNGAQISYLFVASGAVPEEKTLLTTAADPTDAQRFGLGALPAAGTLAVKPAVTLAPADVAGPLPANAQQLAGQPVAAPAAVTFPASVASQANAPSWYTAPANPTDYARNSVAPSWYTAASFPTDYARNNVAPSWYAAASFPSDYARNNVAPNWYAAASFPNDYARNNVAPTWYVTPANPVDYARNNAAPTWYAAPMAGPSASQIASAVWEEAKADHSAPGTFGALVDTAISSRSAFDPALQGVRLAAAGLDPIVIESGINARQALCAILAANAGMLSGADTGSIVIQGANSPAARITATTDTSGNRQSITLNLP